jgi:hypothetical protein
VQAVSARSVILNLPATPLHRVLTNSALPNCTYNPQLFAPYPVTAGKVYLYYPNAWWVQQVRLPPSPARDGLHQADLQGTPVLLDW